MVALTLADDASCSRHNRELRALRVARRNCATQANLAKIIEMKQTISELKSEVKHWADFARHPTFISGEWLWVPRCVGSRVSAMADVLFVHWTSCQAKSSDIHSAHAADVASHINMRANSAKHLGLYSIHDFGSMTDAQLRHLQRGCRRGNFETLSPIDINRIQRGKGKDTSEALDPWVLLDGMASSSATSTSGPFLLDTGSSELTEPLLGCASMSQSAASFDAWQVLGAGMASTTVVEVHPDDAVRSEADDGKASISSLAVLGLLKKYEEPIGLSVTLGGLKSGSFNGRSGLIVGRLPADKERLAVLLDGCAAAIRVKAGNLFVRQNQDNEAGPLRPFCLNDVEANRASAAIRKLYDGQFDACFVCGAELMISLHSNFLGEVCRQGRGDMSACRLCVCNGKIPDWFHQS
jgi:hypothetical protein